MSSPTSEPFAKNRTRVIDPDGSAADAAIATVAGATKLEVAVGESIRRVGAVGARGVTVSVTLSLTDLPSLFVAVTT